MSNEKETRPDNLQFSLGEIYSRLNTSEKKTAQLEVSFEQKFNGLRDHIDKSINDIRENIDDNIDGLDVKLDKVLDDLQKERLERSIDVSKREGAWKTITIIASVFIALGTVFSSVISKIVAFITP